MGDRQGAWWDGTSNTLLGCKMCSSGCLHCYAPPEIATLHRALQVRQYQGITRLAGPDRDGRLKPVFTGKSIVLPPEHPEWSRLVDWPGAKLPHGGAGQPSLLFLCSNGDMFYEGHPRWAVDKAVGRVVASASRYIGLICTKRPHRMAAYFSEPVSLATLRLRQSISGSASALRISSASMRVGTPSSAPERNSASSPSSASRR